MKSILGILMVLCGLNAVSVAQPAPQNLEGKTLEQLYLARNEIYARHGKPFKTNELNTYFRSQNWYKLDLEYTDSRLTPADLTQASAIRQKETELLKQNYLTAGGQPAINSGNIINQWQFGKFSKSDIDRLCANGFLVFPAQHEQLFYLYDENEYKGIANFITTDAILQLYHIFFDFTLRNLETEKLLPILKTLSGEMVTVSKKLYQETDNPKIKEAARRNIEYFSVPYYFVTGKLPALEPSIADVVKKEIKKCEAHSARANSLIFNPDNDKKIEHDVDYSQFVPRGHYTRNEELKSYFMGMLWFGLNYFLATQDLDLIQSLLITHELYENKAGNERLIDLWQKIYEPTVFYVGLSDDLSPENYKAIMDQVLGENPKLEDITDPAQLKKIRTIVRDLWEKTSRIRTALVKIPGEPQFRFMGQRYIPDSEMLQRLSKWPERPFPKGLDITAVLGSQLAKKILLEQYKEGAKWPEYPARLDKLIQEFSALKPTDWQKNLYYSWVWCLKALIELNQEYKYPFFMQNDAWQLKSLSTTLASWAELRHDVILYGKQSGAEAGDGEEWFPDPPKGYVEPNVVFYQRLAEMLSFTREGLRKRDLLTERIDEKCTEFIELVSFLQTVSEKELAGKPVTNEEYEKIKYFGGTLENLTVSIMVDEEYPEWFEIESDVDKNIAVIADVHTSEDKALEEGVGTAFEIYVVVEIDGYLRLTRGAVFSYYEFTQPASDRLTDEAWQELLKQGNAPPLPDWTTGYLAQEPKHEVPTPKYNYPSY